MTHTLDPLYDTPVPIPGDTPSELIELQYDTWAYELKVWAEACTVKRDTGIIRRFVEWLLKLH